VAGCAEIAVRSYRIKLFKAALYNTVQYNSLKNPIISSLERRPIFEPIYFESRSKLRS
jgi:hypothetical protein